MNELREAIIALAKEDMDMIGELTSWTERVVDAFNAVGPFPGHPEVGPITDEDY